MAEEIFPAAFHFKVSIGSPGSAMEASFQDVSGIAAELETETYSEGGENRFSYRLPKAVKYQNLVLARGLAPKSSALVAWCRATLEGGLAKPILPRQVQVFLLDAAGQALRSWTFANAYPIKWQADSFNSTKNEIAIEKIELAYDCFTRDA